MDKHKDQAASSVSTGIGFEGLVVLILIAVFCILGPIYTLGSFSLGAKSPLFDPLPLLAWPIVIVWGFIALFSVWFMVGFAMYCVVTEDHPNQANQEEESYYFGLAFMAGLHLVYFVALLVVLDKFPGFGLWLSEVLS